eukprot:tig00001384_g8555.t1
MERSATAVRISVRGARRAASQHFREARCRCACAQRPRSTLLAGEGPAALRGVSHRLFTSLAAARAAGGESAFGDACAARRPFHATAPAATPKRDPYEVLGVPKSASAADLKKAYFQLAKKYHPDVNKSDKDAEKKFAEINAAYDILKDDEKRKMYDQFGHQGVDAHDQGASAGGFSGRGGPSMEEILREFAQAFGGAGGGMGGMGGMGGFGRGMGMQEDAGNDVDVTVRIGFMDAVNGCSQEIAYDAAAACGTCTGSGTKPGAKPVSCPGCRGRGYTVINMGFVKAQAMCGQCGGQGTTATPCGTCRGSGTQRKRQTTKVDIPAGVADGSTLTMRGKGDAGARGAPPGNLNIEIRVGEHPFFAREGYDIYVDAPITISQAALGATVEVPTLTGAVDLKVPPGTQPGDQRVLRGKGVKIVNAKSHGNMYVNFRVAIPKKVSPRMKELLEELAKEEGAPPPRQPFSFTGAQTGHATEKGGAGSKEKEGGGFFSKIFGGKKDKDESA